MLVTETLSMLRQDIGFVRNVSSSTSASKVEERLWKTLVHLEDMSRALPTAINVEKIHQLVHDDRPSEENP